MKTGGTQESRRRRRRRIAIFLLGVLSVVTIGAASFSLAIFTDSATVDGNVFTTGTIDISTTPTTALLVSGAMMPGDSVNGSLVVANAGTGDLRYAMTTTTTSSDGKGLASQLTLAIKTLGTSCATFDGTSLYSGALTGAFIGDPATGQQTGDRTLATGASETLCFRVTLPLATDNTYQGASTSATFTFDAEQTANN